MNSVRSLTICSVINRDVPKAWFSPHPSALFRPCLRPSDALEAVLRAGTGQDALGRSQTGPTQLADGGAVRTGPQSTHCPAGRSARCAESRTSSWWTFEEESLSSVPGVHSFTRPRPAQQFRKDSVPWLCNENLRKLVCRDKVRIFQTCWDWTSAKRLAFKSPHI